MNKYSYNDKTSYILGVSLTVEALLEIPDKVEKVYLSSKANKNKELAKLFELCKLHNIEIIEDDTTIDKLSLKENCYGIGVFKKYQKQLETDKHLVLYGFKDEGELGTILRSACSFDFKDVILINSNIDIFSPKVIRASMGSFFHLNIKQYQEINDYLNEYHYNIYPFAGNGQKELKSIKLVKPYSIIVSQDYHELDDKFIESYYLKHSNQDQIALTSLCSIVFNYIYHLNLK